VSENYQFEEERFYCETCGNETYAQWCSEECMKLEEQATKDLLELDQHKFGYATGGKEINAISKHFLYAYVAGYQRAVKNLLGEK
jgi:hypothetical protein